MQRPEPVARAMAEFLGRYAIIGDGLEALEPPSLALHSDRASVQLIDDLERQIDAINRRLKQATPTIPTSPC